MARWAIRGPDIETEADLDDYMHEVAGRVGYLITGLFSLFSERVKAQEEENRRLKMEKDILKKATVFFAKETK
jgi:hypothetical protein